MFQTLQSIFVGVVIFACEIAILSEYFFQIRKWLTNDEFFALAPLQRASIERDRSSSRFLFPITLIIVFCIDGFCLKEYKDYINEGEDFAYSQATFLPVMDAASLLQHTQKCTPNGYLANENTLPSETLGCAIVGNFRVIGNDISSIRIFKVDNAGVAKKAMHGRSPWNFQEYIYSVDDKVSTLAELKTAFNVK